jgi:nitroimidazol reductase NimA-like FMN-containing flavoprotein (pyridoxamine 5'-phosphate oxidase superfamily)
MPATEPTTDLGVRFSSPGATATPWRDAQRVLDEAAIFWISTVRRDGRPHVTPLLAVWADDALHVCTGPTERKARNLTENDHCTLTTGCNRDDEGLDVVVEGRARRVTDDDRLRALAQAWEAKYGPDWHFDVRDGYFVGDGGEALVFEVKPQVAFGFVKGRYSQTRWTFTS